MNFRLTTNQHKILIKGAIFLLLVALIFLLSRYGPQPFSFLGPLWEESEEFQPERTRLTQFLISLGPYSVAAFIMLQALQVVVAPIPGELTGLVGGYIYGTTFGFILSTVGLSLGSWVAFELANLFGRPFVERIIRKEVLKKFKFLETNTGATICFLLFVIPGFPKDVLCYVVGLSRMHLVTFLIVTTIGRVPGTYLLTIQGAAVGNQAYSEAALIAFICAALLLAAYVCRGYIFRWVKTN